MVDKQSTFWQVNKQLTSERSLLFTSKNVVKMSYYNYYDQIYSSSDDYYDYNYPSRDYQYDNRRTSDLVAAASGGGDCCPHVVDPTFFTLTMAALAVAVYLLNQAITMNIGGRKRRRKRSPKSIEFMYQESCDAVKCVVSTGRLSAVCLHGLRLLG